MKIFEYWRQVGGRFRNYVPNSSFIMSLQVLCLIAFTADTLVDFYTSGDQRLGPHIFIEFVSIAILLLLFMLEWITLPKALVAKDAVIDDLLQARRSIDKIVHSKVKTWNLSPAEEEVTLLVFKGMNGTEIAQLRGTSEGTTKAQLSSIYRKVGVSSRADLIALILDAIYENDAKAEQYS